MITQITMKREDLMRILNRGQLDLGVVPKGAVFREVLPDLAQDVVVICEYETTDDPPPTISIGFTDASGD